MAGLEEFLSSPQAHDVPVHWATIAERGSMVDASVKQEEAPRSWWLCGTISCCTVSKGIDD